MHFGIIFFFVFVSLGSISADGCFNGKDDRTTLNVTCKGSTMLEVKKQELIVDFKWNGWYKVHPIQNLTFNFGGCLIVAQQQGNNKPQFDIRNEPRYLPLKFIVRPKKFFMVPSIGSNISFNCNPNFELISESSTYKLNVTYSTIVLTDLRNLNVTFHAAIYEPKAVKKFYEEIWFLIVVGVVGFLFIVILLVCFCCSSCSSCCQDKMMNGMRLSDSHSNEWEWPTDRYKKEQLDQLQSFFPIMHSESKHAHSIYFTAFLRKHPLNEQQLEALKKEEKAWHDLRWRPSAVIPGKIQTHNLLEKLNSTWSEELKLKAGKRR
ncbi:hypothetical protein M3Y96_00315100 [Aphelenchoides besseyi]|nr:hypothetical protein M3Y96_00315100 [Aphelenchoides besseyi]